MDLHLDPAISDDARKSIKAQIEAERPSDYETQLHPSIDTSYVPTFPHSITQVHLQLDQGLPKEQGIDLSRYEADALEPPPRTFPTSDEDRPEILAQWRTTLNRAYTSSTYLTSRGTNLSLLETYGKNAWLVGNWNNEAELRRLETELAQTKTETENLNAQRQTRQDGAKAEMDVLEDAWKKSIRGIVEVQVATDGLRTEVLEARSKSVQS
jgi:pre-mRNA-splicing factor SPF27